MSSRALPAVPFLLLSSCLLANAVHAAGQGDGSVIELGEQTVVATAQEETKQAPGVSIITAEDIAKRPPSNDLSQIIRTMPGVNLTGNSSSGQRGNNRHPPRRQSISASRSEDPDSSWSRRMDSIS